MLLRVLNYLSLIIVIGVLGFLYMNYGVASKTTAKGDKLVLIFDFDGVICDSFHAGVQAFNALADEYKFIKLPDSEIEDLRHLEAKDIFKKFGIDDKQIPAVVAKMHHILNSQMTSLNTIPGITDALRELHQAPITLGIISSNSKENIEIFLKKHNINFFNFVYSSPVFNKAEFLKNIMQEKGYQPQNVYYVGDETRDIAASKAADVHSVAVTWGFNAKNLLISHAPEYVFDSPKDFAAHMLEILNAKRLLQISTE